jgi:Zn-dependent M28 family amino/carboxypeptidase
MKIYRITLFLLLPLFFGTNGCSENEAPTLPEIEVDEIEAHLSTLASDEFMGRKPMTEGETKTITYLEKVFREMGIGPGNGDSYFQEVPLINITGTPSEEMIISGGAQPMNLNLGNDFVTYTEREQNEVSLDQSDLVFCGYGIVAPEYEWDYYAGLDMKGKTAVVLVNDPGFGTEDMNFFKGNTMTYYGRWTYKYEEAERQGAAGILIVHETAMAGYPWFVVESSWSGGQQQLQSPDGNMGKPGIQGWLSLDASKKLFENAGLDLSTEIKSARQKGFRPKPLNMQVSTTLTNEFIKNVSNNVVGLIKGSERPNEYIIYTAHWDHLGIGKPVAGDSIYNGAVDNASGTACVLAIAKALNQAKPAPKRSVVFLIVTAEEQGLLGSAYYGQNPIFPTHQTVANLNIDGMRSFGEMKDLTVIGYGQSEMDDIARKAAEEEGRYILPDQEPEKGYFFRSDHFSLAKVGVPALYAEGGYDHMTKGKDYAMEQQEAYRANSYHAPSDEFDPTKWDLSGLVQDAALYLKIGARLANSNEFPKWKEGSEFKAVREKDLEANKLKG